MTTFKRRLAWVASGLVLLFMSLFVPAPYYLIQPGTVESLSAKVTVEDGSQSEGDFFLTTVYSIKASNIYYLAYGLMAPHTEIHRVKAIRGDYTEREYARLLEHMMRTSQQYATVAGLRAAGEDVEVEFNGVFVYRIFDDSLAKDKLAVGDVIIGVDGQSIMRGAELTEYLTHHKKPGDTIELRFLHEGVEMTEQVELIEVDPATGRAGLGILPEDRLKIKTSRQVSFAVENIGGPSSGLMFSLEILDQILPEDLTRGYRIAGTGTIDLDGNVGQIGSIREKIVAAQRSGIDIYFCPADVLPHDNNEREILDEARKNGYDIQIVPVRTIDEAVEFLRGL